MDEKQELLTRIAELIKKAPADWVETAAREMKKSEQSIYAYARGDRGVRQGKHKEVYKILTRLVEQSEKEIKELLTN
nr:hypothetical protein [uncultured Draconibacterium sp.]